jgi:hypothetical protein
MDVGWQGRRALDPGARPIAPRAEPLRRFSRLSWRSGSIGERSARPCAGMWPARRTLASRVKVATGRERSQAKSKIFFRLEVRAIEASTGCGHVPSHPAASCGFAIRTGKLSGPPRRPGADAGGYLAGWHSRPYVTSPDRSAHGEKSRCPPRASPMSPSGFPASGVSRPDPAHGPRPPAPAPLGAPNPRRARGRSPRRMTSSREDGAPSPGRRSRLRPSAGPRGPAEGARRESLEPDRAGAPLGGGGRGTGRDLRLRVQCRRTTG